MPILSPPRRRPARRSQFRAAKTPKKRPGLAGLGRIHPNPPEPPAALKAISPTHPLTHSFLLLLRSRDCGTAIPHPSPIGRIRSDLLGFTRRRPPALHAVSSTHNAMPPSSLYPENSGSFGAQRDFESSGSTNAGRRGPDGSHSRSRQGRQARQEELAIYPSLPWRPWRSWRETIQVFLSLVPARASEASRNGDLSPSIVRLPLVGSGRIHPD